jgi:heat-inducible transcriptional repressor
LRRRQRDHDIGGVLAEARTSAISGLAGVAGVVVATKANVRLRQIDFVRLEAERALAVLRSR